jgi:hypothetical protein
MTRCYLCGQQVPSDQLVRQFMPKGMGNRRRNGWVWMCGPCASRQQSQNKEFVILVFAASVLLLGFIAILQAAGGKP